MMNRAMHHGIEPLESRTLLSGNVSVRFIGDQLRLVGDDLDNSFTVAEPVGLQSGTTSILVIRGLNGTTIDGKPLFYQSVGLGERFYYTSIKMLLGAGDDSVSLDGEMNDINLSVDLGHGDDSFYNTQRGFAAVDIFGGEGRDRIALFGTFQRRVRIFAGGGRDRVSLQGTAYRGMDLVDTGSGGSLFLRDFTAGKDTRITLGRAADRVSIVDCHFFALSIHANAGDDIFSVNNISADRQSVIYGDDGADFLSSDGDTTRIAWAG